jgi:hypothetical protein
MWSGYHWVISRQNVVEDRGSLHSCGGGGGSKEEEEMVKKRKFARKKKLDPSGSRHQDPRPADRPTYRLLWCHGWHGRLPDRVDRAQHRCPPAHHPGSRDDSPSAQAGQPGPRPDGTVPQAGSTGPLAGQTGTQPSMTDIQAGSCTCCCFLLLLLLLVRRGGYQNFQGGRH